MVQGEPQAGEVTVEKDGWIFAVEREVADVANYFEIDYYKGWLRKDFVIYLNGSKGAC